MEYKAGAVATYFPLRQSGWLIMVVINNELIKRVCLFTLSDRYIVEEEFKLKLHPENTAPIIMFFATYSLDSLPPTNLTD